MNTLSVSESISTDARLLCPSCGNKGRGVKSITIESLVVDAARARVERTDGFRFCAETSCDVAYFHPEGWKPILRSEVRVRIGQKETSPPRPVCYCFEHTVEEIEKDVARSGSSTVPDEIMAKCRQGLDRCEETNPQGACCLGNVRLAVKEAQTRVIRSAPIVEAAGPGSNEIEQDCCATNATTGVWSNSHLEAGVLLQFGALASAVVASACCWLPLLLIAVGASGGAVAASFEAWRPVLLPVTFVLLGAAFYFTYRKPRVAMAGTASGGDSCSAPEQGMADLATGAQHAGACCPPGNARRLRLRKVNKALLWMVTLLVLTFALFPSYVGYLLGGGGSVLAARTDLDKVVVQIEGMTCEACAVSIEDSLRKVVGVVDVEVSYDNRQAVVGVQQGIEPPRNAILAAIAGAGNYTGRFTDQVQWSLAIDGMTCEGCASRLQAALATVSGVSGASVNYEEGRARLAADASVTEEDLRLVVSAAGYSVRSVETR